MGLANCRRNSFSCRNHSWYRDLARGLVRPNIERPQTMFFKKKTNDDYLPEIYAILVKTPEQTGRCLDVVEKSISEINQKSSALGINNLDALQILRVFMISDCQSLQQLLSKYLPPDIKNGLRAAHFDAYLKSPLMERLSLDEKTFAQLLNLYVQAVNSVGVNEKMFEQALVGSIEKLTSKTLGKTAESVLIGTFREHFKNGSGPELLAAILNFNRIDNTSQAEFLAKGFDGFNK